MKKRTALYFFLLCKIFSVMLSFCIQHARLKKKNMFFVTKVLYFVLFQEKLCFESIVLSRSSLVQGLLSLNIISLLEYELSKKS